jgi:hypothetical protein
MSFWVKRTPERSCAGRFNARLTLAFAVEEGLLAEHRPHPMERPILMAADARTRSANKRDYHAGKASRVELRGN